MKRPTVASVLDAVGCTKAIPVFKSGSQVQFYLKDNLVLFISPLAKYSPQAAVTSVGAIMQADLYPGNTLAVPERVHPMIVAGLPFPMAATDMAEHLAALDPGKVQVMTTGNEHEVVYGKMATFLFLPTLAYTEPSATKLGLIRFFYTAPFEGKILPLMTSMSAIET